MAARDRYEAKVTCEGCGEVAALGLSEEDHPYIKSKDDLDRTIEYVKGDFTARLKNAFDVVVRCNQCGRETEW